MSKRLGEDAEQDNERPHKRTRLSQDDPSDVFPDNYSECRNDQMFAFHHAAQLPTKVDGGHIRGSVLQVIHYSNRNCASLVLNLGPPNPGSAGIGQLECELRHPRASECQLPESGDTVCIALTEAKITYNAEHDQLSFKLRFPTSLIYVNSQKDGEARILKLVDSIERNAVATTHGDPDLPTELVTPFQEDLPAMDHSSGVRRVRKNEKRPPGDKIKANRGSHEVRRLAKPREAGVVAKNVISSSIAQTLPQSISPQAAAEMPDLSPINDETAVKVPEGQSLVTSEEKPPDIKGDEEPSASVDLEISQIPESGFVTSHGTKFIALDQVQNLPKGTQIDIIGVVERVAEWKRAKGGLGDYSQVFYLSDPSCSSQFLKANLFQPEQSWLPNVQPGQILLLQGVNAEEFQNNRTITGRARTYRWIAYDPPSKKIFFTNNQGAPKYQRLDSETMQYFAKLADWKLAIENSSNRIIIDLPEGKHKLLSHLGTDGQWFNATVEVLSTQHQDRLSEIYVTDYTRNELFEDRYGDPPPALRYKRTLRLAVWREEERVYAMAQVIRPGFYRIKNFRFHCSGLSPVAKVSRRDDAEFQRLRDDDEDPDLRRLVERKKASVPDDGYGVAVQDSRVPVHLGNPNTPNHTIHPQVKGKPVPVLEPLSGHRIVCKTMASNVDLNFIDQDARNMVEYKVRARIVGITPTDPREMLRLGCKKCDQILEIAANEPTSCPTCNLADTLKFDIRLSLLIIDGDSHSCSVIIAGDDARYLFGIADSGTNDTTLMRDSLVKDVVSKLRNIVGTLWTGGPGFEASLQDDAPATGTEEFKSPNSPWIDLVIRSWLVKKPKATDYEETGWTRKYSLSNCQFQLGNAQK